MDRVIEFLETEHWPHRRIADKTALRFGFEGQHGEWLCEAKTLEQRGQVVCYSIFPVTVPEAHVLAITEFITRANDGLIMGNFELSYATGKLRFKTSLDVEGETLGALMIKHLIYDNLFTFDRYLPGLYSMLEHGATPMQAIAQVEG
jgi:hypothetical protein